MFKHIVLHLYLFIDFTHLFSASVMLRLISELVIWFMALNSQIHIEKMNVKNTFWTTAAEKLGLCCQVSSFLHLFAYWILGSCINLSNLKLLYTEVMSCNVLNKCYPFNLLPNSYFMFAISKLKTLSMPKQISAFPSENANLDLGSQSNWSMWILPINTIQILTLSAQLKVWKSIVPLEVQMNFCRLELTQMILVSASQPNKN